MSVLVQLQLQKQKQEGKEDALLLLPDTATRGMRLFFRLTSVKNL